MAELQMLFSQIKGLPEKVYSRAVRKTLTGVKTDVSTAIRDVIAIKKKDLDQNIVIEQARDGNVLTGGVVSTKGALAPLSVLGAKQTTGGVTAKVYQKGDRVAYPSAFVATMKSGHVGVYRREFRKKAIGRPVKAPWKKIDPVRLPIEQMYGPRITTVLDSSPVMKPLLDKVGERTTKAFEQEINYEMSKL
jgi:hypothetical protein